MEKNTVGFVETQSTSLSTQIPSSSKISGENDMKTCDLRALQKVSPEEVWLIILEKSIKDQSNLFQNFCSINNSSSYFRNLLQSKRVLYLFEYAFFVAHRWILAASEEDNGNASDSENDWLLNDLDSDSDSNDSNHTETPNEKPISIIKICRQVCYLWNISIDEIIFEQVIPPTRKGLQSLEKTTLKKLEYQMFENTKDVNRFLEYFKDTHAVHPSSDILTSKAIKNRSPFISREVQITLSSDDDDIEQDPGFPKAIETLLDAYGCQIWSFDISVKGHNVYISNHTNHLKKALSYVQRLLNLKRLRLVDNTSNFFGSLDEAIIEDVLEDEEIVDNPLYQLPNFPNLLELTTSGLAVPIFQHLIQNNNHVSTLKIQRHPEGNYNISDLSFPNLEVLHLDFWTMDHVIMLEDLEHCWLLKQLKFSYCNGEEFPDYSRIFYIIGGNWGNTLTYLNIHLPQARTAEDYRAVLEHTKNERLDLPCLDTFKLIIYQQFFLDFILPTANSLKKIHITQINNHTFFTIPNISKKAKQKEVIKFVALDGQLKKSNIWQLFPSLEYIYTLGCKKVGGSIEEISR